MKQHDFRFGTVVDSGVFLNDSVRRNFFAQAFNSVTLINGFHWQFNETNAANFRDDFYEAAGLANDLDLDIRGHAVLYPNNRIWLNPRELLGPVTYDFDSQTGQRIEVDNSAFHDPTVHTPEFLQQRIADRISGVLGSVDGQDGRALITEFDATNELTERNTQEAFNFFAKQLVDGGLYNNEAEVVADWYQQMRAARPDARLVLNDYSLINAESTANVEQQADQINTFLAAGAPIDAIGVQMHMNRLVSFEEMNERINILSQRTGLQVEITEFDNLDGSTLTADEQRQNLENALRLAFENPNVTGFTMWGAYNDRHWLDNGVLFDDNFQLKPEGEPFFELVRGEWMTQINDAVTQADGTTGPQTLTRGTYELTVEDGDQQLIHEFEVVTAFARLVADLDTQTAYLLGDLNGDDTLDTLDISAFADALNNPQDYAGAFGLNPLQRGDINRDGVLNNLDSVLFAGFFGEQLSESVLAAIPEPATGVLLAAFSGFAATCRRRRSAA